MIENQLADRMRAALTDEPPLGFDPDEVADRASQSRRRRRSSLAAVGATGAVLTIAVTAVVMSGGGGGGSEVGTQVTTTPTASDAACPSLPPNGRPPLNFPGSAQIVARLDEAGPRLIAKHLPGVHVQPSDTGMIAYDCPPNVGTLYRVTGSDQTVMLYLIHARAALDLANDRYAEDQSFRLVGEDTATDGARIRTYEYSGIEFSSALVVVRFGLDGMVTEAYLTGQPPLVAGRAELLALASDPELRF